MHAAVIASQQAGEQGALPGSGAEPDPEVEAAFEEEQAGVLAEPGETEQEAVIDESAWFWGAVDFARRLADEDCLDIIEIGGISAAKETWEKLAEYTSHDERDAAIRAMEACRVGIMAKQRAEAKVVVKDLRSSFAIELENLYDTENIKVSVSGSKLTVTMAGGFGVRARDTEEEFSNWCYLKPAMFFSKITLKSKAHGTFTCEPVSWVGSEVVLVEAFMESQYIESWSTAAGDKPIPPRPGEAAAAPPSE